MFSQLENDQDMEIFLQDENPQTGNPRKLDLLLEKYIALTSQLKQDVRNLKDEIQYYKKIHGELSDSLDEFLTIQKASEIITQHLELNKIAKSLLELSGHVLEFFDSDIYLKEEQGFVSLLNNNPLLHKAIIKNLTDEGIIDWLWEQKHPIVIPSTELVLAEQADLPECNLVIAPLITGNEGVGMLLLFTRKDQANFSLRDIELIQILAQQAAIAMQYTRLFSNLEKAHKELKNSQTQLIQAIKLATVGELAGGIAHEINNPLQIILGKIQIAMLTEKDPEFLKLIETQAMRIATIVRGLLSLARESNKTGQEFIDINPVIQNTVHLVQGQLEKRGIVLEHIAGQNLPIITGSSVSFQQVFLNFLLTAKKQMVNGGKLTIRTYAEKKNVLCIEICDNGLPLAQEVVREALAPFTNISAERSDLHNLGLIVSVQIIREIGGEVIIEPQQDRGNRILIKIPKDENAGNAYAIANNSSA